MPRRRRTAWLLVTLWMAVIAWGSLTPGVGVPPGPDALVHGWAYLILAWLLRNAMAERRWSSSLLLAAGLAWGFGLLMEGLQMLVVFRSGELRDLAANAVGVGFGVALPVFDFPGTDAS